MTTTLIPNHLVKQPKAKKPKQKLKISVSLNGVSELIVEKKTINDGGSTEVNTYPLTEVTEEELFQLRVSGKPGFVLKKDNSYFYTEIPRTLNLVSNSILGTHKCSTCKRFFSSTTLCPKVSDPSVSWITNRIPSSEEKLPEFFAKAVKESSRIEKFAFITEGYETFFCPVEAFVVVKCDHYGSSENN